MIKKLKQLFNRLFGHKEVSGRTQSKYKLGDKVNGIILKRQYQLDKYTDFKVGESYRVGHMIATVRASKAEVTAIIEAMDAKRAAKEEALRERGIELMMMSPEELKALQLDTWLARRKTQESKLRRLLGKFMKKGYIRDISAKHEALPPAEIPKVLKDSEKSLQTIKVKDKIH